MHASTLQRPGGPSNSHLADKTVRPDRLGAVESGVDTWRLARYLDRDVDLDQAVALCSVLTGSGGLHPEKIAGHRVGVLPGHRMLWMEGHPAVEGLAQPSDLAAAEKRLHEAIAAANLPIGRDAGCGRLDSTVTLAMPDSSTGLAFLAGLAVVDVPRSKPAVYGRPPETVYFLSEVGGRKLARAYDKGLESKTAPRGLRIRLEAQTRYTKEARRAVNDLDPARSFSKRFTPVAEATDGLTAATFPVVADRVAELVQDGRLTTLQAEKLLGYLALQGRMPIHPRTRRRRRRELRRHGLVLVDPLEDPVDVDLGEALDAALAAWSNG